MTEEQKINRMFRTQPTFQLENHNDYIKCWSRLGPLTVSMVNNFSEHPFQLDSHDAELEIDYT